VLRTFAKLPSVTAAIRESLYKIGGKEFREQNLIKM